ncbi:MAG: nitrous oxide reductase family maturation protein NosD [Cyclobacteriaceae bacterium]|nr:nitrous oxide reductase family maturation protein NosD [Cyclobacteriaceae bacterium]
MKQFFIVLVLTYGFLSEFSNAYANTIEVCETCKISTITEAIATANKGDTILINSGFYQEGEIIIDKPLVLLGINKPIIDGNSKAGILIASADSVVINGLIVQNIGVSYIQEYAAIHISNSKYFTIENNELREVFFGILVEKSHYGLINNNQVSSNAVNEVSSGNGIHMWHSSNIIITNNHLSQLRDGIYFEFVTDSHVANNISINNLRYGLHFMFSNNDSYYNNQFINNGAGVAVMFSKFIEMKRNRFYKNWGSASFGLLLKEINDAEIEDNIFEENTIGINIEGSTRINYKNNNFIRNGWAIKIRGGCYANIFDHNNFIDNSFDISYNSKMNDNSFDNNYWSDYTGYDLDKDGIGDVPYRPVKLFSYIVNQTPETIILLRSLFIDILNFSEKVSPVFTPDNLVDATPKMKKIQ